MENEEIEIFKIFKDTRSFDKDGNLWRGALWEVSNLGRVRKNGDVYIPSERKNGYLAFGGHYLVHRAVAELFLERIDSKPTVDHLNRDKQDNRLSNLRWATYKEQRENVNEENLRMKLSAALKGRKLSEEHRAKIGAAHLGFKYSEESKAKMSAAKLGNKNFLGHKHSKEAKAKMSAARIGNKHTLGKVYVFNPTTEHQTCVNPSQLNDYLAKGYIRGNKNVSGKVYVINPLTEHITRIDPSELNDFLAKGYVRGMKQRNKEIIQS